MTQDKHTSGTPVSPTAGPSPAMREQVLSLAALVILLVLACVVFTVAGAEAFSVVTCVGVGLFSTWRTRRY